MSFRSFPDCDEPALIAAAHPYQATHHIHALDLLFDWDHAGFLIDGRPSGYPVPWSALLGDVLQPLALRQWRRILLTLPPPRFTNDR